MPTLRSSIRRFVSLFVRARHEREFAAELDAHLQSHIDDNVRAGMTPAEAGRHALAALGGMTQTKEARHDVTRFWLEDFWRDVRYATRTLARDRGFTVTAVATLALCIGATITIFTLLNAVILRTLPVRNPEELVVLSDPSARAMMNGVSTGERSVFSYHEFEGLRDKNTVFSGVFAADSTIRSVPVAVRSSEQGARARILLVSGGYFPVVGVNALQGRTFGFDVDGYAENNPVAVISYDFWQRRLNGDPTVIGRQLHIRQQVLDVIGVMPPSFTGITIGDATDIWMPLTMQRAVYGKDVLAWVPGSITKTLFLQVVGRRKPGVSLAQLNAAIGVTYRQILEAEAGTIGDREQRKEVLASRIVVRDGRHGLSELRTQYGPALNVLMGLVSLLLLLACANVANLMLARGAGRYREIAMRTALGASRMRLVRQLTTEGVMIATLGGAAGLALGQWADVLLLKIVSTGETLLPLDVHADRVVVAFTVAVTLLTAVLFSLAPAVGATRVDIGDALKGAGGAAPAGGKTLAGKVLVTTQVAISLLLIVVAGLFVRSLHNLTTVSLGYDPGQMLLVRIYPGSAGYRPAAVDPLMRALSERFSSIPGVRAVALSANGLFFGRDSGDEISIIGRPKQPGVEMQARWDQIGPNYFRTIGIPILKGRDVNEHDSSGPPVCWINQTMARYYFGAGNPIGERIKDEYPETPYTCEVVGIVADAKYLGLREKTPRRFYVSYFNPIEQPSDATFEIRFTGSSAAVSAGVRRATQEIDARLDAPDIRTIALQVDTQIMRDRLTAQLSTVVGGLAVLLACVGLFGVLSYTVARRTKELGVRMALGSRRSGIVRLVLRDGLIVSAFGVGVGLLASVAATRLLESLLYGLTSRDPSTFVGAAALLLVVAAGAAAIPAWRATRVDPMVALRAE